jgi:thiamine kinase-like enzyme
MNGEDVRARTVYAALRGHDGKVYSLLKGGLSNATYLVDGQEVLRIKMPSDPAFYDSLNEKKALENMTPLGLSPKLLAFDLKTGDMVTAFVKGAPFLQPESDPSLLMLLGKTIAIYQKLPQTIKPFAAEKRLAFYKDQTGSKDSLPNEGKIRSAFASLCEQEPLVYAHNDLVTGNLLLDDVKKGLCLLDYEFAGLNIPYFDLASLLSENDLRKSQQIETLLRGYLGQEPTDEDLQTLRLVMAYEDILWYYWALARYRETKKAIYLQIAFDKADYLDQDERSLSL